MEIYFDNRQDIEIDEEIIDELKRAIVETLKYEGEDLNKEVSISFVTKEEIRTLNKEYREKDKVTDVLSFPLDQDFQLEVELMGDIILCVERAEEQALEYDHSFKREMVYLTVHSCLHLLGYDHMEEEAKREMRQREEAIMEILEIGR